MTFEKTGDIAAATAGSMSLLGCCLAGGEEPKPWSPDDNTVVLREQPETRIFLNNGGTLTVMQRAAWDEDQDPILTFTLESLPQIIEALRRHVPAGPVPCKGGGARV